MVDQNGKAELPAAYEIRRQGVVASLRQTAITAANQGAEEGTIIVAENQTQATGCGDKTWRGLNGNFHAALVLQPDIPSTRYHELLIVAAVSLCHSIAEHIAPMTALSYGWPNDVLIARHKIASFWMDQGQYTDLSESRPWITLTHSVNIAAAPEDMQLSSMSIHEAEGDTGLDVELLLESWARQFIAQINDWSDKGFEHTMKLWRSRINVDGALVNLQLGEELVSGSVSGINMQGDLEVAVGDDRIRRVSVREYMKW